MINNYSKFCLSVKNVSKEGLFSGYASVFDVVDSDNDVIDSSAFDNIDLSKIKFLWQHNQDAPIGKILELYCSSKGLYIKGQILLSIQRGYEAYELIKNDIIDGLSIGYVLKDYYYDNDTGAKHLTKIDLLEISLVTFPSNPLAKVVCQKKEALDCLNILDDINKKLDCLKKIY